MFLKEAGIYMCAFIRGDSNSGRCNGGKEGKEKEDKFL
jgi:hypothetical protein